MLATPPGGDNCGTPIGVWPTDPAMANALLGQWQNFDLKAPPAAVNRLSAAFFAAVIAAVGSATLGLRFWCASTVRPRGLFLYDTWFNHLPQTNDICPSTLFARTGSLALVFECNSKPMCGRENNGIYMFRLYILYMQGGHALILTSWKIARRNGALDRLPYHQEETTHLAPAP